jgi:hypothetical protein
MPRVHLMTPLVVFALLACSPTEPSSPAAPTRSPTPTVPSTPSPTGFIRDCDAGVFGEIGRDFRKDSIAIGPIFLLGAAHLSASPKSTFSTRSGGPKGVKVLLLVREGPVTVTMSIRPKDRSTAGLLYDPRLFNTDNLDRADRSITFVSCDKGSHPHNVTQFNGSFLVDGPQCLGLSFDVAGRAEPLSREISFGAGDC